jgi:Flp pilus assembly protein TadD
MRATEQLLERAEMQILHRDLYGAIETLRKVLTDDPDHAMAHAMLALCLHDQKRIYAAKFEAGLALALDPDSTLAHHAMAMVALAQRDFVTAERHFNEALRIEPGHPTFLRSLARLYDLWNKPDKVLPLLEQAREALPDDAENWAALAEFHFEHGDARRAEPLVRQALELDPENPRALVVMGHLLLKRGEVEDARQHALTVLSSDATHEQALHLLSAIKARQSFVLGLWWRFNSFVSLGSMTRRVAILLGLYLAYRIGSLVLVDLGYKQATLFLSLLWLGFCIYTWVGPAWFNRKIQEEFHPASVNSKY